MNTFESFLCELHDHIKPEDFLASLYGDIRRCIKSHGVFVLATPDFTYSIGHAYHDWPDIVINHPAHTTAHMIIMQLHHHWKEHGFALGRNDHVIQTKNGQKLPVFIEEIAHPEALVDEYTVQANNFYCSHPEYIKTAPRFVQVYFPDEKGKLPFEDGFNDVFAQPSLNNVKPPAPDKEQSNDH